MSNEGHHRDSLPRAPDCNKVIPFDTPQEASEEISERLFTKLAKGSTP